MTAEQFAYWLNGFVELNGAMPSDAQWKSIKEHLAQVFKKLTPPVSVPMATHPGNSDILKQWMEKAQREHQTVPLAPWQQQYPWPTHPVITC